MKKMKMDFVLMGREKMDKIEVTSFNDLPFEERKRITFYTWEEKVLTLNQVLNMFETEIGSRQKDRLKIWIKDIQKSIDQKYEVRKDDNCKD